MKNKIVKSIALGLVSIIGAISLSACDLSDYIYTESSSGEDSSVSSGEDSSVSSGVSSEEAGQVTEQQWDAGITKLLELDYVVQDLTLESLAGSGFQRWHRVINNNTYYEEASVSGSEHTLINCITEKDGVFYRYEDNWEVSDYEEYMLFVDAYYQEYQIVYSELVGGFAKCVYNHETKSYECVIDIEVAGKHVSMETSVQFVGEDCKKLQLNYTVESIKCASTLTFEKQTITIPKEDELNALIAQNG